MDRFNKWFAISQGGFLNMIQTINLTKQYDQLTALDNLNLVVEQGDCFGFIGPNGAGKTTTIRILATLLKPTWGEARIDGLSVGPVNARQVRSIIGYVPDHFGSYEDMVVQEYLSFFAAAYDIHNNQRKQVIGDVLELTGLTDKASFEVNSLSRGMQQRLSLARVLLHDPKVLLLDEPASGLDPRARIEIRELLKELHRMGKTILISSHILLELAQLCNKVGIIEQGRLIFTGTVQEVLARAEVEKVFKVGVRDRTEEAANLLRRTPGVIRVHLDDDSRGLIRVMLDAQEGDESAIAKSLVTGGFAMTQLVQEQVDLETAFMRLTKGLVQ